MKFKNYEEMTKVSYLVDRATNLGSEIRHAQNRLDWLKKEHAQVAEDAEAVRELLRNAEVEDKSS